MRSPDLALPRTLLASAVVALATVAAATPAIAQEASPVASPLATVESAAASATPGQVTLYTSVTQDTVDAVLAALAEQHPDLSVEVFRAPTGELDARIASELRSGGVGADVLWVTDPLSLQRYDADGMLALLDGEAFEAVPPSTAPIRSSAPACSTSSSSRHPASSRSRSPGPTLLTPHMPARWPSPTRASRAPHSRPSATSRRIPSWVWISTSASRTTVQSRWPRPSTSSRASRRASTRPASRSTSSSATRLPMAPRSSSSGRSPAPSPCTAPPPCWPTAMTPAAAQAFVEFLVSPEGQAAIASTGWQPVREDVEWPDQGPVVAPDWPSLFGTQEDAHGGLPRHLR